MNSQKLMYSKGDNDEMYTPEYAVTAILKHIINFANEFEFIHNRKPTWWCPFDKENSPFVEWLTVLKQEVVCSHIDRGHDFFEYEPKNWDVIISNHPFTNKRKIFERALEFNKPFALMTPATMLNDKYPMCSFVEYGATPQIINYDNRIIFEDKHGNRNDKITFKTIFLCRDFLVLGKGIEFAKVPTIAEQKKM